MPKRPIKVAAEVAEAEVGEAVAVAEAVRVVHQHPSRIPLHPPILLRRPVRLRRTRHLVGPAVRVAAQVEQEEQEAQAVQVERAGQVERARQLGQLGPEVARPVVFPSWHPCRSLVGEAMRMTSAVEDIEWAIVRQVRARWLE